MKGNSTQSSIVNQTESGIIERTHAAAERVAQGYEAYWSRFARMTSGAHDRFRNRDWLGMQRDALNRLLLYGHEVDRTVEETRALAGADPGALDGVAMRKAYARWCASRPDVELAETFYNSVARRLFGISGAMPRLEFVGADLDSPAAPPDSVCTGYAAADGVAFFTQLLRALPFADIMQDVEEDARLLAQACAAAPGAAGGTWAADVLPQVFYRGRGAYVVGRLTRGGSS